MPASQKLLFFSFLFFFFFFSLAIWRMYLYLLVQKILHDMTTVGPCFLRKPLFCKYIQTDSPLHITFDLLHILVVVCLTNDALVLCAFFFFFISGAISKRLFLRKNSLCRYVLFYIRVETNFVDFR